ncbi:MAG: BatD family protein [Fusobacteriaceae bacterium]
MRKFYIIIIFLLIFSVTFSTIRIRVDKTDVFMNETLTVEVSFENVEPKNYKLDGIEKFDILSTATSQSIMIVNIQTKKTHTETFILKPKSDGNISLQAKAGGEVSQAVNIKINKGIGNRKPSSQQNSGQPDPYDLVKQLTNNSRPIKVPQGNYDYGDPPTRYNYFILPKFSSNQIYFGQKVIYSEEAVLLQPLNTLSRKSTTDFDDISSIDLTEYSGGNNLKEIGNSYKGQRAIILSLYKGIIQANSSGNKTIQTSSVEIGTPGGYLNIGGEGLEIKILPLPAGRPNSFRDIVGQLQASSSWSSKEIKLGETVTLNIRLYGNVNVDNIDKFGYLSNQNYNVFESAGDTKTEIKNNQIFSEKNFEIAFVPKVNGKMTIPDQKIGYFNPATRRYEEKIISGATINVVGIVSGLKNSSNAVEYAQSNQVAPITPEESNVTFVQEDKKITGVSKAKILVSILLGIILLGAIFYFVRQKFLIKKISGKMSELELEKNPDKFYDIYVEYMKRKYKFNPNVHSEIKLQSKSLVEVCRIMEEFKYGKKHFDMQKIIEKLKEEEKN